MVLSGAPAKTTFVQWLPAAAWLIPAGSLLARWNPLGGFGPLQGKFRTQESDTEDQSQKLEPEDLKQI